LYRRGYSEWENPLLTAAVRFYTLSLRGLLACRWLVLAAALAFVGWVSLRIAPRLGIEFLPYIDEGVIWVRANFPEGMSLERNSALCRRLREIVLTEFPDIQGISVQSGRNDTGNDPTRPVAMKSAFTHGPTGNGNSFAAKRNWWRRWVSDSAKNFPQFASTSLSRS